MPGTGTKITRRTLVGMIAACLSFLLCLIAGLYLLFLKDGKINIALGLYFIGKAFFVGPLLLLNVWPAQENHAGNGAR